MEQFVVRNSIAKKRTYFWTFSEPGRGWGPILNAPDGDRGACWTKDEAESHFKPFTDLLRRRGAEFIVIWQLQKRGSWHPHVLTNLWLDVNWLRAWMMERGWGQQMFVEVVKFQKREWNGTRWEWVSQVGSNPGKLIRYLVRYLSRGFTEDGCQHRKLFCSTHASKVGNVDFKWNPYVQNAGAFLYAKGLPEFVKDMGRSPHFNEMMAVISTGVWVVGWDKFDPLWRFAFPMASACGMPY